MAKFFSKRMFAALRKNIFQRSSFDKKFWSGLICWNGVISSYRLRTSNASSRMSGKFASKSGVAERLILSKNGWSPMVQLALNLLRKNFSSDS